MELKEQTINMLMSEKEYDETPDEIIQRLVRMNRLFFKVNSPKSSNA
jgi:hypothetical protein